MRPNRIPLPAEHAATLPWRPWAGAAAAALLTATLALPLRDGFGFGVIVPLFLLCVVLCAVSLGRGPALLAAVTGAAAFDFLFLAPFYSFEIQAGKDLVTVVVMLVIALFAAHFAAGKQDQMDTASREARSAALYHFARELTGVLEAGQVYDITRRFIRDSFRARATLLLPDRHGRLKTPPPAAGDPTSVPLLSVMDMGVAQWSYEHAEPAGIGTATLPSNALYFLPLVAPMRTRGVLAIQPKDRAWLGRTEQLVYLQTYAALAAIALERVHYIEVAQEATMRIESEHLRNSLLAALSHDLRTPLTSLAGLAESLARSKPLAEPQERMAHALHAETRRLNTMVTNLLDMARMQAGEVKLNLQWQALEEVVGSALRARADALAGHRRKVTLPPLPLVKFDALLIESVLCNLLENAAKYTSPGSTIEIAAAVHGTWLEVTVADDGPGIPAGREEAVFDKFTRGDAESNQPGVGLGLAICRAIVEAHGGRIFARPAGIGSGTGAVIVFTLPLGTPPAIPEPENHE